MTFPALVFFSYPVILYWAYPPVVFMKLLFSWLRQCLWLSWRFCQTDFIHPVKNTEARGGNAIHPSGRVRSSIQGSWLQASGCLSLDHAASSIMKYWPSPCLRFSLFKQFAATKANWPLFAFLSNDFLPELSDPAETISPVLPYPSPVLLLPVLTAQPRKIESSSHSGDMLRSFSCDLWWWKCHGAFRQKFHEAIRRTELYSGEWLDQSCHLRAVSLEMWVWSLVTLWNQRSKSSQDQEEKMCLPQDTPGSSKRICLWLAWVKRRICGEDTGISQIPKRKWAFRPQTGWEAVEKPGNPSLGLWLESHRSFCPRALVLMSLHATEDADSASPGSKKDAFPQLTRHPRGEWSQWACFEALQCWQASGFSHLSPWPSSVVDFITSSLAPSLHGLKVAATQRQGNANPRRGPFFPVCLLCISLPGAPSSPPLDLTGPHAHLWVRMNPHHWQDEWDQPTVLWREQASETK